MPEGTDDSQATSSADDAPGDDAVATDEATGGDGESTSEAAPSNEFQNVDTHTAKDTHGVEKSKLKPTKSEALLKFVVVDKDKGPIEGVVVALTGPDGKTFHSEATDAVGYAEALIPVGKKYDIVFVSLKGKDRAASTEVPDKPNLTQKLTLRYKGWVSKGQMKSDRDFVLSGVQFDTGKATIRPESYPRLDSVLEYMQHKKGSRIVISGHTDNVGKKEANKVLSQQRAMACRAYLVEKGIDKDRIEAVGYGDERPLAPNDSPEGRQRNRRIEAQEL